MFLKKFAFVKRLVPLMILAAAGAAVFWVASMPAHSRKVPPTPLPPTDVATITVKALPTLDDSFELHAVVEPNKVVRVAAEVSGQIEQRSRAEGEAVKQGAELIRLNTDLLQADFNSTKATSEYDQRELERQVELQKRGITAAAEIDAAQMRASASKAAHDAARTRLGRARIYAPISGVLDKLLLEKGEYVQPGTPVAQIVDMDTAKVVAGVPERDIAFLRVGDQGQIVLGRDGQAPLTGRINYISELSNESTRTTRIELTVDNAARQLRSGQIVMVRLTRRQLKDVIMIPLGAIIPLEKSKAVFVVEQGLAQARPVEISLEIIRGQDVLVTGGLAGGEQLIVEGQRFVGVGQRVNVVSADGVKTTTAPASGSASAPATQPTKRAQNAQSEAVQ